MKRFAILSFLLESLLLINSVFAQVQYYGIEAILDEKGRTFTKLTITFTRPERFIRLEFVGKIENIQATSIAGPVACESSFDGISSIRCEMNLTEEKRAIELTFETNDFVRTIGDKFFFDADFSLNKNIDQLFVYARLPEGMVLAGENKTVSRISFPKNVTTVSDGRRIIVVWKLSNFPSDKPLRIQMLYEKAFPSFLPYWQFVITALIIIPIAAFFLIRYLRKPEKMVLSVLDEYERKVIDIVINSGGTVKQKKIVQETNLSKAKVSRVIKSLVNRGLVEVERIGRTNKIKLVKKGLKF